MLCFQIKISRHSSSTTELGLGGHVPPVLFRIDFPIRPNSRRSSLRLHHCIHVRQGKGKSYIRSVCWGVPIRADTCPGPSALWGRVASSFPCRLYLLSVFTRSPFAAGWTVSKRPTLSSKCVSNRGSSVQYASGLSAMLLAHCIHLQEWKLIEICKRNNQPIMINLPHTLHRRQFEFSQLFGI